MTKFTRILKQKKVNVWSLYKFTKKETISLNKKTKQFSGVNPFFGWVSATRTKNYLNDDKCVDWLMLYDNKEKKEKKENYKVSNLLFDGGITFEKKVYEELKKIYKDNFVIVFTNEDLEKRKSLEYMKLKNNETKKLMNDGIPIIAQVPLLNHTNKTYGIADLIVRSDYLQQIFYYFDNDEDINIKAPRLKMKDNLNYHYRVIDIKWTNMTLCVDGKTIRNEGLFPAYKGQLAVYTNALQALQGYTPNYAYIMAKSWKIGTNNVNFELDNILQNNRGYSTFDRLGVIDYSNKDNYYVEETKKAIMWVQKVITEGDKWSYNKDKPSVPELYPNMNKTSNSYFDKIKEKYALQYGDPTFVWYVNSYHRDNLHKHNIFDIRDDNCSIEKLGISNDKRGSIISKIIDINKTNNKQIIYPKYIKNNFGYWQQEMNNEYYIDFESINCNLYDTQNMDIDCSFYESQITFMVGIGFSKDTRNTQDIINKLNLTNVDYYINENKNWEFVCFYLKTYKNYLNDELELFKCFEQFVNLRRKNNLAKLFHWTNAEKSFMTRANLRNKEIKFNMLNNNKFLWIDMCKIFETTPIVIKGAFRFKLKHIAKAFYNQGFIKTHWKDNHITDGLSAMLNSIEIYKNNNIVKQHNIITIIEYNEIDCKVIWEIVNYLRQYHT